MCVYITRKCVHNRHPNRLLITHAGHVSNLSIGWNFDWHFTFNKIAKFSLIVRDNFCIMKWKSICPRVRVLSGWHCCLHYCTAEKTVWYRYMVPLPISGIPWKSYKEMLWQLKNRKNNYFVISQFRPSHYANTTVMHFIGIIYLDFRIFLQDTIF